MRKGLMALLLVLAALTGTAAAAMPPVQSEALDLDGLQAAGEQWAPGVDLEEGLDLEAGLQSILDTGSGQVFGVVRKAVRSAVLLLTVVMLCGLAESFQDAAGGEETGGLAAVVGAMAVAAIAITDANSLIGMGREALEHMQAFSKLLLPAVAAAAAAAGSPGGAAARHLATMLFSDVLITVITSLLLPLLYLYMAACVGHAALGNEGLKRVASAIKWAVTAALCAILLIFVGYLTVSGAVAGTADAAAVKAAKFAMSSVVPVVGGILSDAAETVLAGAGILKNVVGVFGMLVVLGICLVPFLQLGIHYLAYKFTAALSAAGSGGRVAGLIDQIGGAFGLVLGMTGSCALLLLISMVSAVTAAAGG